MLDTNQVLGARLCIGSGGFGSETLDFRCEEEGPEALLVGLEVCFVVWVFQFLLLQQQVVELLIDLS